MFVDLCRRVRRCRQGSCQGHHRCIQRRKGCGHFLCLLATSFVRSRLLMTISCTAHSLYPYGFLLGYGRYRRTHHRWASRTPGKHRFPLASHEHPRGILTPIHTPFTSRPKTTRASSEKSRSSSDTPTSYPVSSQAPWPVQDVFSHSS